LSFFLPTKYREEKKIHLAAALQAGKEVKTAPLSLFFCLLIRFFSKKKKQLAAALQAGKEVKTAPLSRSVKVREFSEFR